MAPLFESETPDWDEVSEAVLYNADLDGDQQVTAAEMADAFFYEFEIDPNNNERVFITKSLSDVCTWY